MALDWLPGSVAGRLGFVHFFIGDPLIAGLHRFEVADDGGPCRTCAHDASECHQRHRAKSARRAPSCCRMGPVERQRLSTS